MNKVIATLIAVLIGVLLWRHPDSIFILISFLPYILLFVVFRARRRKLRKMCDVCLRQKEEAEKVVLPDSLGLIALIQQAAEKEDPTHEALQTLVHFGCRLSLSNVYGKVIISLENPDTAPTYMSNRLSVGSKPEILELPGLRGRQKDCIGKYKFWRTEGVICFAELGEDDLVIPSYLISFNPESLNPLAFGILRDSSKRSATYQVIWGPLRGTMMWLVI